jgi:hypothetical protein
MADSDDQSEFSRDETLYENVIEYKYYPIR